MIGESDSILVLRSGAVGDCILSTPALAALRRRFPNAWITLLGDPFSAGIFLHSPDVDRVVALDSKQMRLPDYLAALRRFRGERFSLLVDMHGAGRSFLQTAMIGGKRRIGFDIRRSRSFVYTDLVPYRTDVHTVLRQAEILRPLDIDPETIDTRLRLILTEDEREETRDLLRDLGHPTGRPYAVLHAGAGIRRDFKQWLPDRFAALADRIQEELGIPIVVTGQGGDEQPGIEQVLQRARMPILSLFGKTNLRTLAALLESAQFYVGCDTGPMHVAAAMDVPVVALFGPTDPVRWHPWSGAPYRLVRMDLPCSPCPGKTCDFDVLCMRSITVDQVFNAVHDIVRVHAPLRQPLPL